LRAYYFSLFEIDSLHYVMRKLVMFLMKKCVVALAATSFVMLASAAHAAGCTSDGSPAAVRANAIAEALTIASAARTAYSEYFQSYGVAPGSNAMADLGSPTQLASGSCWTRSVNVNTDGVRVQVAATPGYAEGVIELRSQLPGSDSWTCGSPDIVQVGSASSCSYSGVMPRKGLTWGKSEADVVSHVVVSSCHGQPTANSADGSCNPYKGDEVCSSVLPVLCVAPSLAKGIPLQMAATIGTKGASLTSPERGNEVCQAAFGKTWRMAEFHDAGGWSSKGLGNVDGRVRHWVRINDQKANCWD
jgi:hypothetical protein